MRNVMSILLTLVCAIVILGAGYLGIVDLGKQILKSESVPERAAYENAGSNIFYAEIQDDIEIFPWNYYPEESVVGFEEGRVPVLLAENAFAEQHLLERSYAVQEVVSNEQDITDQEGEWIIGTDSYFSELIAHETGVAEDKVFAWFQEKGRHILQNMVMSDNLSVGELFFYQDILDLEGKKYQVRIACNDWNIINFVCVEYDEQDRREQQEWKEGKKKMVEVLERSEESLSKYFFYMSQLNDMGAPTIYYLNGEYRNAYLQGFLWLENIMQGNGADEELSKGLGISAEEWKDLYQNEKYDGEVVSDSENQDVEYSVSYSYQVVELKDMILLLVQGDVAMGLYYDPVNRKFCGYNFFYEY